MAFGSTGLLTKWLGGGRQKPEKVIQRGERECNRSESRLIFDIRNLDREIEVLMSRITDNVSKGKNREAIHLAKEVVNKRRQKEIIYDAKCTLSLLKHRMSLDRVSLQQAEAFRNVTIALSKANIACTAAQTVAICREFSRQREIMELKREIMEDQADEFLSESDYLDEDDEDQNVESIVDRVREEVNMKRAEMMSTADATVHRSKGVPIVVESESTEANDVGCTTTTSTTSTGKDSVDDELQLRLARLKLP